MVDSPMAKRKLRAARAVYPGDLTDAQWALIAPLLPPAEPGGRDREVDLREVLNGILHLLRSGCSWRMLPHDLPPGGTVHSYTTVASGWRARGSNCTSLCVLTCAWGRVAIPTRVPPSWIVSRSRRPKRGTATRL